MLSMKIRTMQPEDLDFAAHCTENVGWDSETRQEIHTLYLNSPDGCFIAEIGGQKAGMCMTTNYGDFSFLGELIVIKEFQGQGIGSQLLTHAIDYSHFCGSGTIYLDAVLPAVTLYERAGFHRICRSWRFSGMVRGQSHRNVRAMKREDLEAINELDRHVFGAPRNFFLARRLELYPTLCKVLHAKGKISGFIMGRCGRKDISIGPWIVSEQVQDPASLLESLARDVENCILRIGILDCNPAAIKSVRAYGFQENSQSPWRMALGSKVSFGDVTCEYAIGSPGKG